MTSETKAQEQPEPQADAKPTDQDAVSSKPKKASKKPDPTSAEASTAPAKPKPKKAAAEPASSSSAPASPDFRTLKTVEELVEAYNDMVPTATDLKVPKIGAVKMFVDVKTGVLACERLHSLIVKTREKQSSPEETTVKTEKSKMSKSTKKNARKGAVKGKTTAKKPATKRLVLDETAKIQWLGNKGENPFREGSGKFERVEKVRAANNQTVKTFLSKGGKTGTLRRCVALKLAKLG